MLFRFIVPAEKQQFKQTNNIFQLTRPYSIYKYTRRLVDAILVPIAYALGHSLSMHLQLPSGG